MNDLSQFKNSLQRAGLHYVCDYPLSSLSSFKIGGPAAIVVYPATAAEINLAITAADACSVPYYVIGNGTNILFPDAGFKGCIICLRLCKAFCINGLRVTCDAGASLSLVSQKISAAGLGDLSFFAGIPGSVGGAVYMNAGAWGGEIGTCVEKCAVLDTETGRVFDVLHDDMAFGYRQSVFQSRPLWIIVSVTLLLQEESAAELLGRIETNRKQRSARQPLDYPSAGSVFKRPATGYAARMIDECGLKGCSVGGAAVSEKHAGFIINKGAATAADVRELIAFIQAKVFERFGIALEPEIKMMEEYVPQ